MTDYTALEAELRDIARRDPYGPTRYKRAADAIAELTKELRDRELHHFETEQQNARLTEENRKLRRITNPSVLKILDDIKETP